MTEIMDSAASIWTSKIGGSLDEQLAFLRGGLNGLLLRLGEQNKEGQSESVLDPFSSLVAAEGASVDVFGSVAYVFTPDDLFLVGVKFRRRQRLGRITTGAHEFLLMVGFNHSLAAPVVIQ